MSHIPQIIEQAQQLASQRLYDRVVGLLAPHLERHPDDTAAWKLIASAYAEQQRWSEAEEAARHVLEARPDVAQAWCNWGLALRKLNRLEEARQAQLRALALAPTYPRARHELGKIRKAQASIRRRNKSSRFCTECGYALSPSDTACPRCIETQQHAAARSAPQPEPVGDPAETDPIWRVAQDLPAATASAGSPGAAKTAPSVADLVGYIALAAVAIFLVALVCVWIANRPSIDDIDYAPSRLPPAPVSTTNTNTNTNTYTGRGATTTPHEMQWYTVARFSGTTSKNTATFTVGDEWGIMWDFRSQMDPAGNFIIWLKRPGDELGALVANTLGSGSEESYQYEAGTYYMEITAMGSYTITIRELR